MPRSVLRSARIRAPSTRKRLSGMNRNLRGRTRFRLQQPTEARRKCFGYSSISSPNEQDLANLQEAPSETDASGGFGAPWRRATILQNQQVCQFPLGEILHCFDYFGMWQTPRAVHCLHTRGVVEARNRPPTPVE